MPSDLPSLSFTLEFKRNLRTLAKKYRSIRTDLRPLIDQLSAGELPGDRVPGVSLTIFKVRLINSDIRKGKRSGYRCIYYVKAQQDIVLLTIYFKSERSDVSTERLQAIISEFSVS